MKPTLTTQSGFTVAGIAVRTINRDEANPDTAKLPAHWGRFFSENLAEKIPNRATDSPIYGVYSEYESDGNGHYTVTAGVRVDSPSADYAAVQIDPCQYLVFEKQGDMPQIVIDTWMEIWKYFETSTQYKRRYTTDFELYEAHDRVKI